MAELVWSKTKQKMVRVKSKGVTLDRLVGTEEGKDLTDEMLSRYIQNAYFRVNELDLRQLSKELPLSRRDRDVSVEVYLNFMDNYLNRLKLGRVPEGSYIVCAPDGFGKKVFVYQAIKEALMHEMEPTPLMGSHDLYVLLDKKEYEKFYQQFNDVDMAFITLGGAPSKTDLIVIKTALEYCERLGVPLLVISRFEPETFHNMDIVTSTYLGVKKARRGDFGKMELAGFGRVQMNAIRDEIRERSGLENKFYQRNKKEN